VWENGLCGEYRLVHRVGTSSVPHRMCFRLYVCVLYPRYHPDDEQVPPQLDVVQRSVGSWLLAS
jgi:hypothetical protein